MPNNLSILRDLGRARRDRQIDQGPVTDFEPIEVGDFVLSNYLSEAVPAFLQPRLDNVRGGAAGPRELQSLLLTTRIHASAVGSIKAQIEKLAADATVPTTDLARRAAAAWYVQLDPQVQAGLRRRIIADIIHLGARLGLTPASANAARSSTVGRGGNGFAHLLDRLMLRIRG